MANDGEEKEARVKEHADPGTRCEKSQGAHIRNCQEGVVYPPHASTEPLHLSSTLSHIVRSVCYHQRRRSHSELRSVKDHCLHIPRVAGVHTAAAAQVA